MSRSRLPCPGRSYRWLLFDADGTLFDYERAEVAALAASFRDIGISFQPLYLDSYRRINTSLWHALEQKATTPEILKRRRFELLFDAVGVQSDAGAFSERYLQHLADCSQLLDGAQEVLALLRPHYDFAIVTNGLTAVQRGRIALSSIRDLVAHVIISEEIGHAKPAREFFEETFRRLGRPAKSEVLMIGDNWSSDIVGAALYGIDVCWLNPARKPQPDGPAITCQIASLRELLPLLLPA